MSDKLRPSQYADAKGVIAETFETGVSALAEGPVVPADTTAGYGTGSLFMKRLGAAGAQLYINEGTKLSCLFKPLPSQVNAIVGVGAGYRIARGQFTTVSASDTVVTGLTTVVSAVANMDDAPVIGADRSNASIGNQAGAPAAGSILIVSFKPTAVGDATPIPATTFGKKVNWIAIGT